MAEKGNIAAAAGGGGGAATGGGGGRSPMGIMSSPEIERQQEIENGSNPLSSMRTAETLLRLVPMGLCIIALMIMLKDSQSNQYASLSYSDLGAFRFLVHANGICAGYSFLSAVVVVVPRPSTLSRAWTFFLLDQVLTYMILAAGAVATVVSFLAYKGDEDILWAEACGSYGAFCRKAIASIVITFVVMLSYAALSLLSSYRLFTNYDAPVGFNHRGIEITAFQP